VLRLDFTHLSEAVKGSGSELESQRGRGQPENQREMRSTAMDENKANPKLIAHIRCRDDEVVTWVTET
jgi:hypothetical protein